MIARRKSYFVSCLLLLLLSSQLSFTAFAKEPDFQVDKKAHLKAGRFELSAFFYDVSLLNKFVKHPYGFHVNAGYNVYEWLSLEVLAGFTVLSDETKIVKVLKADLAFDEDLQLRDLWQTSWKVGAQINFELFYGKLSFISEFDARFKNYFFIEALAESISKLLNSRPVYLHAFRFSISPGIGLQIFLTDMIFFRGEIKQSIGFNPKMIDSTQDVSTSTWFQLGVGFLI